MTMTTRNSPAFGRTAAAYCRQLLDRGMGQRNVLDELVASGKCKDLTSARSIYRHVTERKPAGRKFVRRDPGDVTVDCPLTPLQMERLQMAADARDMAPGVLAIFNAVLDDGEACA